MEQGGRSVENAASWRMAFTTLAILSVTFGSPLLIVVGMKPMQERSAPTAPSWRWRPRWSGSAPARAAC